MAKYASKDTVIKLSDGVGGGVGTLQDISQHVRSINGIEIESLSQESHAFGDSWVEVLGTGMSKVNPITIEGFYDDSANTPATLWGRGETRNLEVTYGGGKKSTVNVVMQKFSRTPVLGEITKYSMTLLPSGPQTEV